MIKLWTIQSEDVYEELMEKWMYHTDPRLSFCRDIPEIEFCYRWMAGKLSEKTGPAPEGLAYPVWAWHTWEGKRKRRDMRCSGYGERSIQAVFWELRKEDVKKEWHFTCR